MNLAIGPIQTILTLLVLLVPVGTFVLGFFLGKKSGYLKRVKETENQKQVIK